MKNFEYAIPRTEQEAVGLLAPQWGHSEILAGGTDLLGLMKRMIVTPQRVVNIKQIDSLHGIAPHSAGVTIGATTTLDVALEHPALDDYPALKDVIRNWGSLQLRCQCTVGGELLHRPQCWYFRSGHGLLARRGQMVLEGDSRYHAVLGNQGPAKFVHASRLAPALVALGAQVRVVGPDDAERQLPLEHLYRTPRDETQREHVLAPNEFLTHIHLPPADGLLSAAYEVRQSEGPYAPLAAAAAALRIEGGRVTSARVVLGQVAPTPWVSVEAARVLEGRAVDPALAEVAGEAALSDATPLKDNTYKVTLAKVAVKRAILLAAGFETGGF
jgi:xanthine dehydrogenase YagS FAD-binding subunit